MRKKKTKVKVRKTPLSRGPKRTKRIAQDSASNMRTKHYKGR